MGMQVLLEVRKVTKNGTKRKEVMALLLVSSYTCFLYSPKDTHFRRVTRVTHPDIMYD